MWVKTLRCMTGACFRKGSHNVGAGKQYHVKFVFNRLHNCPDRECLALSLPVKSNGTKSGDLNGVSGGLWTHPHGMVLCIHTYITNG